MQLADKTWKWGRILCDTSSSLHINNDVITRFGKKIENVLQNNSND